MLLAEVDDQTVAVATYMRVLQKVCHWVRITSVLRFIKHIFYYKPSKYSPFTETHFCNLFTQSRKADK